MTVKVGDVIDYGRCQEDYDALPNGIIIRANSGNSAIVGVKGECGWSAAGYSHYNDWKPSVVRPGVGFTVLYVPELPPVKVGDVLVGKEVERCKNLTILRDSSGYVAVVNKITNTVTFAGYTEALNICRLYGNYTVAWVPEGDE